MDNSQLPQSEKARTLPFGKGTAVVVSVNGLERTFQNAADALLDESFGDFVDNCGYNDTGGGWRDTYRRRYTKMILDFASDANSVKRINEHPHLTIRKVDVVTVDPKNDGISRLITKQGLVEFNDNSYGSDISRLNELAAKAKVDFPSLKDDDINVVLFGGISKKGILGLHFKAPASDPVPEYYMQIGQREYIQ